MKTLKITTDNKISIIDLDFDHKSLREEVGGYVELVRTQKLLDYFKTKVVMIVDEEGLVKNLPMNPMGCYFYDTDKHGNPIVGDVILKPERIAVRMTMPKHRNSVIKLPRQMRWR